MTYNEKKSIYESIMKEVAQRVKRSLNESFNSNITKKLYNIAKEYSVEHPNIQTRIDVVTYDSNVFNKGRISNDLEFDNGVPSSWSVSLSDFSDDCFSTNLLVGEDAVKYLNPFYDNNKKEQDKITKQGYIIVRIIKDDDIHAGDIPKDEKDVLAFVQLNKKGREMFDEMGRRWLSRRNDDNKPLTPYQQARFMHKDRDLKKEEIRKKHELENKEKEEMQRKLKDEELKSKLEKYGLKDFEELKMLKNIAVGITSRYVS